MTTGRNEPCPCGSGKKYKKCCLAKDEEQARTAAQREPQPRRDESEPGRKDEPPAQKPERSSPPPSRADEIYEELADASYDDKFALFARALREPEGMDGETVFEALQDIFAGSAERGERDRFDAALADLKQERPDLYASEVRYLISLEIDNAIAGGRRGDLEARLRELAAMTPELDELVMTTMDQLAFHGEHELLARLAEDTWRTLASKGDTTSGESLSEKAALAAIYDHVEGKGAVAGSAAALAARLSVLGPEVPADVPGYVARLTNDSLPGPYSLDDFRGSRRDARIGDLTLEFVGYLHRHEDVPYCKAALAGRTLSAYLAVRGDDGGKKPARRSAARRPRDEQRADPRHPLLPERATLDRFLSGHFQVGFVWEPYPVAALLELLPSWLGFLESRGLLDPGERERTEDELEKLVSDVRVILTREAGDPELTRALEGWPRPNAGARAKRGTTSVEPGRGNGERVVPE